MGTRGFLKITAVVVGALCAQPAAAQKAEGQMTPDLTGTYVLVSRHLTDGSTQVPPAISGMFTFTGKYRNFNIMWKDAEGKTNSISCVAEYTLTPTAYTEKPIMWVMTNEASPEKVSYTAPAEKGTPNPVTIKDGAITFPIAGELPMITVKGDDLTAVVEGEFVDHWKKVGGK